MLKKFFEWEKFIIKAALVLGGLFALVGLVLGPTLGPSIGAEGFSPKVSLTLAAQGAFMIFVIGTVLNVISTAITSLLRAFKSQEK